MTTHHAGGWVPETMRFDTQDAGSGLKLGFAHLARPRQMNALTVEMCEAMLVQFGEWASDEAIACVVLDADGDKAFCSGGDVVTAVRAIRDGGARRYVYGDRLFAAEYRLVQAMFEFPKPFVSWARGVTMGAGLGLAAAASHRIASPGVRMAMPESRIGLFPDVGAAWFLGRAPGNAGPLIALTGAVLNVADALFAGLTDWIVADDRREQVFAAFASAALTGDPRTDCARVANVIAAAAGRAATGAPADGELAQRHAAIHRIGRARSVEDLRTTLAREAEGDAWLTAALASFDAGSPTSLHVGFEHFRRMHGKSLRETLAADLVVARAFVRGHDFPEGVRAALIDKDRRPAWNPACFDGVSSAVVQAHFSAGA